jgi:neuronal guanine nucleotide exchange factor
MLIITKKKSDEYFSVLDYCDRNLVQVTAVDDDSGTPDLPPGCFKHRIRLEMLQSQNKKNSCCYFNFPSETERERWIGAILPPQSSNPEEKLYDEWDCPQVICTRSYSALQPDELSLDEADSVNVFRKLNDWFEGERIRDGVRGWFPAESCEEIPNKHVRARNLRLRHRLMVLTGSYLQHHAKS